ncbi:8-oxo-dGDP phosphatase NUDT18 [Protopterus annectens]|uniref:8-oxo-dGDP phosphatase NUDT18 n=1 Tax=Protopterus annectens TaxID=7888 RepID=UPI001CFBE583|nr:8-oxo-dGDP phosphatase NUDT18 [Protopterus annectens]XP_043938883.1 8-oxo-dGDP phosphatase NUDT18 [Protopterus annectens]XP_043938884.1 8-oxo-dGDP phosphatase NUDT18 [Protopterus annectens]XP_043938886.1 8-oxo-dGDP phosphatase NUDT18 [Protopterus annectens]
MLSMEVEEQLELILNGKGIEVPEMYDSAPLEVHPVTVRKTVCYIVCAVLLNEKSEVLMIQEAKWDCYGKWYLPAGRMEQNETIIEAMKREVKEESGLECCPITLLLVEERGPRWIRFVFLAEVTGGVMKTTEQSDSESLQACWWNRTTSLPLRATDIIPLIEAGVRYRESPTHPRTLPQEMPCSLICQRVMVAFTNDSNDLWVLLSTVDCLHLPVTACGSSSSEICCSIEVAIYRLMKECLHLPLVKIKTHGIMGLQHLGKNVGKADGICFNTLVSVLYSDSNVSVPPTLNTNRLQWWKVDKQSLHSMIIERLASCSLIPICS